MMKPVVLIVLDGWGFSKNKEGNAIDAATLPNYRKYLLSYPHTLLSASGEAVGLPKSEVGNTEVGHLNLGAGKIVYQDLLRINMSIVDGSFFQNESFLAAISHVKKHQSKLHLVGLLGEGAVHAASDHLYALIRLCKEKKVDRVFLHLFTDGRDSSPTSAVYLIQSLEEFLKKEGTGEIATIVGRYYAMDRDNRMERTQKAFDLICHGVGEKYHYPREAIEQQYLKNLTDEFIPPIVITDRSGAAKSKVSENDAAIIFNFRIDRARQIARAFLKASIKNFFLVTMTEYERGMKVSKIAFPPIDVTAPLGLVLAGRGISQLRATETEKERFVTYYFNGQREQPFPMEDRIIVPSAKVPTYDLKPEMSANEITDAVLKRIGNGVYGFVLINFANPDMVGHTGVFEKAVVACEAIDQCLGKLVPKVLEMGGACIITADHGKVEEMGDPATGRIITEHTKNPVPAIFIHPSFKPITMPMGTLADIAPTILALLDVPQPAEMAGKNLLANL